MLRRLLDSPTTYFVLAAVLLVALVVLNVKIDLPREGRLDQIAELPERDELNVVFILIDTLRADHLGAWGYERDTSPVMDEIARYGVRFSNVVAQSSWTKASMASLWTAKHPAMSGVLRYPHGLDRDVRMPAEILKEAGFVTAGLYRNGWVDPNFGFGQGFDVYLHPRLNENPREYRRRQLSHQVAGSDLDLTQTAREFLRHHRHRRFMLYLHYMDVHQYAYDESSALFGTEYVDYYDNAIRWTDSNIGMLIQEMIDLDLFDKTLIVIASDHGEEFRDHGREGHAKTLYREVVHTPLIFSFPFRLTEERGALRRLVDTALMRPAPPGGITIDTLVQNVDIWPTILDLLDLPPLEGATGRSLVPLMVGSQDGYQDRAAFAQLDRHWGRIEIEPAPFVAVTTGDWKMIRYLETERRELFDRLGDPAERRNLASQEPEVVRELDGLIDQHLAAAQEDGLTPVTMEIDEMRLNQLRAIGYNVGN